jgi:cysteinyl-tRNA synthetase
MLRFYNTLTRKVEDFVPLEPGKAGMYCCGPTVYNYAHIGNLRTYVFEDILRRTLRFNGFAPRHVMNITDVGHLESDADEGEDKMEKGARREGLDVWELARKYETAWLKDMAALNIERPEVICRATEHIPEMIELVQRLLDRGYAYIANDTIYFDTSKFADYAKLARLDLRGLQAGAGGRVQLTGDKRHPNDFALWFTNRPRHLMQWDSPWGRGYPGWHIECSAMSMKYLGPTFDIHCGGVDHIQVHHTNEIAQSEGATGQPFVRYWLHGEWLLIGSEKMSKSTENFLTLSVLAEKGFDPLAYRYLCLQAHYRSELRFTLEALEAAQNGLRRVYAVQPNRETLTDDQAYADAREEVLAALNDDLNVPQMVGLLNRYGSYRLWLEFDQVLGLDIAKRTGTRDEALPADVVALIEERNAARKARNWAESDRLRDALIAMGYEVGDGPTGTTVRKRPV